MILTGNYRGKSIPLPPRDLVIGREKDCFIRLFSSEISRQHCILRFRDKTLYIEDLNSSNGTLINGLAIEEEVPLRTGDRIKVGPAEFQVCPVKTAHDSGETRQKEEQIAGWLQGRNSGEIPDLGTTVVTPGSVGTSSSASTTEIPVRKPPIEKTVRIDRAYRSLHEEAQAIIQRHLQLQKDRSDYP